MNTVAIAIVCKAPRAGASKTRLSPPLTPTECAGLSGCFIRDVTATIAALAAEAGVKGVALYTPAGTEAELRQYLPDGFELVLQSDGDFGDRLMRGTDDILRAGHAGAILVNSDSPTLPKEILRRAADAVRERDQLVLGPAHDGGYTLIGLSRLHARLFEAIPWSTSEVYRMTLERAAELGLPVATVPGWYDVDDAQSLGMLRDELAGVKVPYLGELTGARAAATREFVRGLSFFEVSDDARV